MTVDAERLEGATVQVSTKMSFFLGPWILLYSAFKAIHISGENKEGWLQANGEIM